MEYKSRGGKNWRKKNSEVPQTPLEFEIELCGLAQEEDDLHPEENEVDKQWSYDKLKEMGNLFVSQGEHNIAKHFYLRALTYLEETDLQRVGVYLNLALVRLNEEDTNGNLDCIFYTSLAETLDPRNIKLYLRRAKAFENCDQYEESLVNLLIANELALQEKKAAEDMFEKAKKDVEFDLYAIQKEVKELEDEEATIRADKEKLEEEAENLSNARKKQILAKRVEAKKIQFDEKKAVYEKAKRMAKMVSTVLKRVAMKDKGARNKQKKKFGGFLNNKKKNKKKKKVDSEGESEGSSEGETEEDPKKKGGTGKKGRASGKKGRGTGKKATDKGRGTGKKGKED